MKKHIVLVGMMGSGKTSFGRKLAAHLKCPFIDADHELEKTEATTIPQLFERAGEAAFRAKEKAVIARLLAGPTAVIATGGGAVTDPETRALIAAKAHAIWLQADVGSLVARIGADSNRPLLQKGPPAKILGDLLEKRASFYTEAPLHVKTDTAPFSETLETIIREITAKGWL